MSSETNDQQAMMMEINNFSDAELNKFHPNNNSTLLPEEKRKSKVLMGISAILKNDNGKSCSSHDKTGINNGNSKRDSAIIHDLVIGKYRDLLDTYSARSFKRRTSRESLRTYDSNETTAMTLSSVGTPSSCQDETNNVFTFRNSNVQERFKFLMASSSNENKTDINSTSMEANPETSFENYIRRLSISGVMDEVLHEEHDVSLNRESNSSQIPLSPNTSSTTYETIGRRHSLFSRAYGSVRRSLKKTLQATRLSSKRSSSSTSLASLTTETKSPLTLKLEQELVKQNCIILQVLKALNYCKSMKEFVASPEHVEAEKILLLASLRKEAILTALNHYNCDSTEPTNASDRRSLGTVIISNLKLSLNIEPEEEVTSDCRKSLVEHFVIVLACNEEVYASSVVHFGRNHCLELEKTYTFPELLTDFLLTVSVYCMRTLNNVGCFSHESKYHLEKDTESQCPTPKSMLTLNSPPRLKVDDVSSLKPSAFVLYGRCYIKIPDLARSFKQFKIFNKHKQSRLTDYLTADLKATVAFNVKKSGYLSVGRDVQFAGSWNRRWCALDGSFFRCWNYSTEEESTPLCLINLANCCTRYIDAPDPNDCKLSNTLMVPIEYENDHVRKYFFNADTEEEIEDWKRVLNYVLNTLVLWNCLNTHYLEV